MKEVAYICSPPLLDFSIEQIKTLSQVVELDVFIFISFGSNSSILKSKNNKKKSGVYDFKFLSDELVYSSTLVEYFKNCNSVRLVYFSNKIGENIIIYKNIFSVLSSEIEIIHFDDISGIGLIYLLYFFRRKIVLNIHDPIPHSGEKNFKNQLIKRLGYYLSDSYVLFSAFSLKQFKSVNKTKKSVLSLELMPYNFYRISTDSTVIKKSKNEVVLLFFGRISTYKGVDLLIEAFNHVKKKYPNIKLIIAGKGDVSFIEGYNLDNVEIRNYFIEQDEMSALFFNSDLLICPYKDATQSGVLMTARAFGLDHLVSNVGGLLENSTCPDLVFDIADNEQLTNKIIEYIEAKGETKFNRDDSLVNISLRNSYLLKELYESLVC